MSGMSGLVRRVSRSRANRAGRVEPQAVGALVEETPKGRQDVKIASKGAS